MLAAFDGEESVGGCCGEVEWVETSGGGTSWLKMSRVWMRLALISSWDAMIACWPVLSCWISACSASICYWIWDWHCGGAFEMNMLRQVVTDRIDEFLSLDSSSKSSPESSLPWIGGSSMVLGAITYHDPSLMIIPISGGSHSPKKLGC